MWQPAEPACVVRAHQKDASQTARLAGQVARALPPRTSHLAPALASALYACATTLRGLQTLGEEYSGIVQVDHTYRKLPSLLARVSSLILMLQGESIIKKILTNHIKNNSFVYLAMIINELLPQLRNAFRSLSYINGGPVEVSKAVMGTDYVQIASYGGDDGGQIKILGAICLVHTVMQAVRAYKNVGVVQDQETEVSSAGKACPACFGSLTRACALPCGHIACCDCSYGPLTDCPLCRAPFRNEDIIQLQNFIVS